MNIAYSILVCLAVFGVLILMLRTDGVSLGLPIAYLLTLYMIHLPGAFAHLYDNWFLTDNLYTEIGIGFTALASTCFVAGVWFARRGIASAAIAVHQERRRFWSFCLLGGWIVLYGLYPLHNVASLGAVVDMGGAIWILGVLLALRYSVSKGDLKSVIIWTIALSVFPVLRLLQGGFLGYGVAAAILAVSCIFVTAKRLTPLIVGFGLAGFLGASLFVNYFLNRDDIRNVVWFGASYQQRVDAVTGIFRNWVWFDPSSPLVLIPLDMRLNQNYFAGLAAERIKTGQKNYLYGQSLKDAALALIPRTLWPQKTVAAGSGNIVADMTGLDLNPNTSWGVGNVMELQINFGIPGIVIGFFGLGWLLGRLDRKAAIAEATGQLDKTILYFLVAAALVQPNGSFVELSAGAVSALLAGFVWKAVWKQWSLRSEMRRSARWGLRT